MTSTDLCPLAPTQTSQARCMCPLAEKTSIRTLVSNLALTMETILALSVKRKFTAKRPDSVVILLLASQAVLSRSRAVLWMTARHSPCRLSLQTSLLPKLRSRVNQYQVSFERIGKPNIATVQHWDLMLKTFRDISSRSTFHKGLSSTAKLHEIMTEIWTAEEPSNSASSKHQWLPRSLCLCIDSPK